MPKPCRPSFSNTPTRSRHAGYSMVEFSVVAVPVLMAGLGCLELAQWFFVKQAVSLALLEAGRAGITRNAHPQAIEAAFEHALQALYPATGGVASSQRLHYALEGRRQKTGGPPWQIEILQPGAAAFSDFGGRKLAISVRHGLPAIDNNYQAEQHRRNIDRGWAQGRGPASGLSVYEANTLALRLTYLHEPLLPGIKGLVRQLAPGARGYGAHAMSTAGYLPLSQEIRLTMQSHPLQWPALPSGKVVGAGGTAVGPPPAAAPCMGLWCFKAGGQAAASPAPPESNTGPPSGLDDSPAASPPTGTTHPDYFADPGSNPSGPLNPECGTTLCCLPG